VGQSGRKVPMATLPCSRFCRSVPAGTVAGAETGHRSRGGGYRALFALQLVPIVRNEHILYNQIGWDPITYTAGGRTRSVSGTRLYRGSLSTTWSRRHQADRHRRHHAQPTRGTTPGPVGPGLSGTGGRDLHLCAGSPVERRWRLRIRSSVRRRERSWSPGHGAVRPTYSLAGDVPGSRLPLTAGPQGTAIVVSGSSTPGPVVQGPYWRVLPGTYVATINYQLASGDPRAASGTVLLVTDLQHGHHHLASGYLPAAAHPQLVFTVINPVSWSSAPRGAEPAASESTGSCSRSSRGLFVT